MPFNLFPVHANNDFSDALKQNGTERNLGSNVEMIISLQKPVIPFIPPQFQNE